MALQPARRAPRVLQFRIHDGMSEDLFQKKILELGRFLGWNIYHIPDSRRATAKGFPDLVISGFGRVLFRELKTANGRISKEQKEWIENAERAGLDVAVWRPCDWDEIEQSLSDVPESS